MSDAGRPLGIAPIEDADVDAIASLWERCGLTRPWNDPHADIARARRGPNSAILAAKRGDAIVASVMVGHDGHRGWFYYLGVDPEEQGSGLGRQITAAAERWLKARGIGKAMLLIRPENTKVQGFYAALGYQVEPRTLMTRWLDDRGEEI
jgi:ribosomal protein S18 acetylase RimI-like enzyme